MGINFHGGSAESWAASITSKGRAPLSKEEDKLKKAYDKGDEDVKRYVSGYTKPRRMGGGGGTNAVSLSLFTVTKKYKKNLNLNLNLHLPLLP